MKKKKTIPKLKKEAQLYFNKYIRERDTLMGQTFKCISCGKTLPIEKMQAGHYFPVKGFDWMRFDEDNVHGECQYCNGFNKAHLIYYTWNLLLKIGNKDYNKLLEKSRNKKILKREYIEYIIRKYKK